MQGGGMTRHGVSYEQTMTTRRRKHEGQGSKRANTERDKLAQERRHGVAPALLQQDLCAVWKDIDGVVRRLFLLRQALRQAEAQEAQGMGRERVLEAPSLKMAEPLEGCAAEALDTCGVSEGHGQDMRMGECYRTWVLGCEGMEIREGHGIMGGQGERV